MYKVEIIKENCKSCLYCIDVCKKNLLQVGKSSNSKGYLVIESVNDKNCIGCKMCAEICPEAAIEIIRMED